MTQLRNNAALRIPIGFGLSEFERLHDVAFAAAIQTGAKGVELDETIAGIVAAMVLQTNRAVERELRDTVADKVAHLTVIEGGADRKD